MPEDFKVDPNTYEDFLELREGIRRFPKIVRGLRQFISELTSRLVNMSDSLPKIAEDHPRSGDHMRERACGTLCSSPNKMC